MVKKHKGYTAKTKGRMFVIFLFFGAIIATLGYTLVFNLKQVNDMKKELAALEKEKVSLLEEEEATEADIKRLSDPLYVARYAREKYLYSKEGEIILRIEE
ncbi:MAG: septum formation initiator family protein [Bacilli bacterium]|nr:septum formation initiator family protein [Bacilli bacterium]